MSILKKNCFACFTDVDKNLKTVLRNDTEDKVFTHIKYALPELDTLNSDTSIYICPSCTVTLGYFYAFKKKCLENYSRWKHYIQNGVINFELVTEEQQQDMQVKINEEKEDPLLSSTGNEIETVDSKPLIKQEPEVQIVSDCKVNETVDKEDNIAVKDESLACEQEFNQQPEFVNVKCELASDDEQDGGITSDGQQLKCIMCSEVFLNKSNLDSHVRSHINSATGSECQICKKTLAKSNSLKGHMKFHFGLKDYECSICQKKYAKRGTLNLHLKGHAGIMDFECGYCNKKFIHNMRLKEHMRSHLGIKDFECTICGKKFGAKSALKVHEKRHAGIKEFGCTVCSRKFVQKCNLEQHMRNHLGIKDYECEICSRKFSTKSLYTVHMNAHAGIRNFECTICNKKFVDNGTLKLHMKYHLGVKNFECKMCKKKFVTGSNLQEHMDYHLRNKKYECPICKKKFIQSSGRTKHMKFKHTKQEQEDCSSMKT